MVRFLQRQLLIEDRSLTTLFRVGHPRKVLKWGYVCYISTDALNKKKPKNLMYSMLSQCLWYSISSWTLCGFFSPYFVFDRSRLYTTDVPFHYWCGILDETGYHKYIIKLHGHLKYRRYTSSRKIGFCWMRDVGSIEGCKGVLMPLFHISRSYIS